MSNSRPVKDSMQTTPQCDLSSMKHNIKYKKFSLNCLQSSPPAVFFSFPAKSNVLQFGQHGADRSGQQTENKNLSENGEEVGEWPQFRVRDCFAFAF